MKQGFPLGIAFQAGSASTPMTVEGVL